MITLLLEHGHTLDRIMEFDYRQFIYFVDCAKTIHNTRKIELFNLLNIPRGDEQKMKEFMKNNFTV